MKPFIMAALIVIFVSSISEGTDWEYFMQNNKGDNYYIDLDSIRHSSPDNFRISKKVESGDSSKYYSLVSDIELDCREKRIRVLKESSTNKNGTVKTIQKNMKWQNVNAADIDELLMEFVCSLKKSGR